MSDYTLFNVGLGVCVAISSSYLLRQGRFHLLAARIGLLLVLIAYPWDFFAIKLSVWTYSAPGPRLFSVPLNDLIFIFLCTYLTVTVLLYFRPRGLSKSHSRTQAEDAREQDSAHEGD